MSGKIVEFTKVADTFYQVSANGDDFGEILIKDGGYHYRAPTNVYMSFASLKSIMQLWEIYIEKINGKKEPL